MKKARGAFSALFLSSNLFRPTSRLIQMLCSMEENSGRMSLFILLVTIGSSEQCVIL